MPKHAPAQLYARYLMGQQLTPEQAEQVSHYLEQQHAAAAGRSPGYGPADERGELELFAAGGLGDPGLQEPLTGGAQPFTVPQSFGAPVDVPGGFGGHPDSVVYTNDPDGAHAVAYYNLPDLRDRGRLIIDRIRRDSLTPQAISDARRIVGGKVRDPNGNVRWEVQPRDGYGEIRKVYDATLDPNSPWALRYVHDHPAVDHFATYDFNSRVQSGDCDEGTTVIGTRLRAIGYPLRLRIIQTSDPGVETFNHIYLVAGVPALGPTDWVSLDWSTGNPLGWEIEGAADLARAEVEIEPGIWLARSTHPIGRVVAVLDMDV